MDKNSCGVYEEPVRHLQQSNHPELCGSDTVAKQMEMNGSSKDELGDSVNEKEPECKKIPCFEDVSDETGDGNADMTDKKTIFSISNNHDYEKGEVIIRPTSTNNDKLTRKLNLQRCVVRSVSTTILFTLSAVTLLCVVYLAHPSSFRHDSNTDVSKEASEVKDQMDKISASKIVDKESKDDEKDETELNGPDIEVKGTNMPINTNPIFKKRNEKSELVNEIFCDGKFSFAIKFSLFPWLKTC